jgi:hypothetical protein
MDHSGSYLHDHADIANTSFEEVCYTRKCFYILKNILYLPAPAHFKGSCNGSKCKPKERGQWDGPFSWSDIF